MLDEIHFIFRIQSDFHGYGINNKNSTVFRSVFPGLSSCSHYTNAWVIQ